MHAHNVICPNCGEEVCLDLCVTKKKVFYWYKTCEKCGGNFTKISPHVNVFICLYFIALFILALISICIILIKHLNIYNQISSCLIFFLIISGFIGLVFNFINSLMYKRLFKKTCNGFLPLIEDKEQKKIISYLCENKLSDEEKKRLYIDVLKNNIIVILTYLNLIAIINKISKTELEEIQVYNTYKIIYNELETNVILTDYVVDEKRLMLSFKTYNKQIEFKSDNSYVLSTLDNKMISNITISIIK